MGSCVCLGKGCPHQGMVMNCPNCRTMMESSTPMDADEMSTAEDSIVANMAQLCGKASVTLARTLDCHLASALQWRNRRGPYFHFFRASGGRVKRLPVFSQAILTMQRVGGWGGIGQHLRPVWMVAASGSMKYMVISPFSVITVMCRNKGNTKCWATVSHQSSVGAP